MLEKRGTRRYKFPLHVSTTEFVKQVRDYYLESNYVWVLNEFNRVVSPGQYDQGVKYAEKYLVLSEQEKEVWGDQRDAYSGSLDDVIRYYKALNIEAPIEYFAIHISMFGSGEQQLKVKYGDWSLENPIDFATEIFVQAAPFYNGGANALGQLIYYLCDIYPEIKKHIEPPMRLADSPKDNSRSNSAVVIPPKPQGSDLEEWLMYRLKIAPFGVNLELTEIAQRLNYSYENVKKKNKRLRSKLRKQYGLEDGFGNPQ